MSNRWKYWWERAIPVVRGPVGKWVCCWLDQLSSHLTFISSLACLSRPIQCHQRVTLWGWEKETRGNQTETDRERHVCQFGGGGCVCVGWWGFKCKLKWWKSTGRIAILFQFSSTFKFIWCLRHCFSWRVTCTQPSVFENLFMGKYCSRNLLESVK